MKIIDAANLDYRTVNEAIRKTSGDCTIEGCCGQRFIAAGMSGKNIKSMAFREMHGRILKQCKYYFNSMLKMQ